MLINKILTTVLELVKQHQECRVSKKLTMVGFNFTEGWFRTSGLYELQEKYQLLERKEIYERRYPETKHGGDRKSEDFKRKSFSLDSFSLDTAKKLDLTPQTINQ